MPPEIPRRTLRMAIHPSASEASREGPAYHATTPVDHGVLVLAQSTVRKGPAQAFWAICRSTHLPKRLELFQKVHYQKLGDVLARRGRYAWPGVRGSKKGGPCRTGRQRWSASWRD